MPSKNKPKGPANGKLFAKFDGKAKRDLAGRGILETSTLVLLSIADNDQCRNEYLQAVIEESIKFNKQSIFLVADELYWHNLKSLANNGLEIQSLKDRAINKGSKYLSDNLPAFLSVLEQKIEGFQRSWFSTNYQDSSISDQIEALNRIAHDNDIPFQVIRWHEWLANNPAAFSNSASELTGMAELGRLYDSEKPLSEGINQTMHEFVGRRLAKGVIDNEDTALITCPVPERKLLLETRSRDYLRDESLAIFLIAEKLEINYIAYPKKIMDVFQATKDYFNINPIFANWLQIGFRKKHINLTNLTPSATEHFTPIGSDNESGSHGRPECRHRFFSEDKQHSGSLTSKEDLDDLEELENCDSNSTEPGSGLESHDQESTRPVFSPFSSATGESALKSMSNILDSVPNTKDRKKVIEILYLQNKEKKQTSTLLSSTP